MSKINLTIDTDDLLPSYSYDGEPDGPPESLQALVIEAAARQILRSENFDQQVRRAVEQRITEHVDDQVGHLVREVLSEPFQPMTPWGEKRGDETTVREEIRKKVEAWFSAPARRDSFSGRSDRDTLQGLVEEITKSVMDKELKAEVDRVRREVSAEIRDKALRAAVEAISPR